MPPEVSLYLWSVDKSVKCSQTQKWETRGGGETEKGRPRKLDENGARNGRGWETG